MKFRRATIDDIPNLVKIIIQSESTGAEIYSYASLFGLNEKELGEKFSKVINNEFTGHGLCYKDFHLIEIDNEVCGGVCFYKEGSNGNSNHLMTGALMSVFTRAEITAAFKKLDEFREIHVDKTNGNYQLDTGAIFENHRGKGLFGKLFDYLQAEINIEKNPVELHLWKNNFYAIKAYDKMGCKITQELPWEDNGRVIMIKEYNEK